MNTDSRCGGLFTTKFNRMKTLRQETIELIKLKGEEFMPEMLKPNTLYYSKEYGVACHLCLCGCGVKCCIPINDEKRKGEWDLIEDANGVTIKPSLQQLFECRSHYIITNGIANFV